MRRAVSLLIVFLVLLPACDRAQSEEAESNTAEPTAAAPSEGEGQPAVTTGPNYTLNHPSVSLTTGEQGQLQLRVVPSPGFKNNLLYPWRLELTAGDQVEVVTTEFSREMATTFTEEEAVFDIPVSSPSEGQHEVGAHLRFSVCNDSRCDLPQETFSWTLATQ